MKNQIWALIGVPIALITLGAGYHIYKLNGVKSQVHPIAVRDNVMIIEALNMTNISGNSTWAEIIQKLDKNRQEREERVRELEAIDPYVYGPAIKDYIKLLNIENEYIKTSSLSLRALFRHSTAKRSYKNAGDETQAAIDRSRAARSSGDTLSAQMELEAAKTELGNMDEAEVQESYSELKVQANTTANVLKEWDKVEKQYYPSFLPERNIRASIKSRSDAMKEFLSSSKSAFDE